MACTFKISYKTVFLIAVITLYACSNRETDAGSRSIIDSSIKKTPPAPEEEPVISYQRPPIVNIVDTLTPKRIIIYSKDSAANFERISLKLGNIYGVILPEYIKKNNLKTAGAPMAWYRKLKAPYFFEAGIPVNKKGNRPVTGVQVREIKAGKAVIAHFYGPFELLPQGYDAIKEWMKDNKKTAAGAPYEIYLTDPIGKDGKPVDPYKIQTDIIFPVK